MSQEYFLVHTTRIITAEIVCELDNDESISYWGDQYFPQPIRHFKNLERAMRYGHRWGVGEINSGRSEAVDIQIRSIRPGKSSVLEFIWNGEDCHWYFA